MSNEQDIKPFIFYSDKLNFKSFDGEKGKEFWVEGHVTTGDPDLVNDIVTKNCMDSILNQFDLRSIKLDWEHEAFNGETLLEKESAKTRLPLGRAIKKVRDLKGVKVSWKLNPNWKKLDKDGKVVMDFKNVWQSIEDKFLDSFSIAYIPTRTTIINKSGVDMRLLDDIQLLNVALTGNPINPNASMTSVMAKSLEFMKKKSINFEKEEMIEIKSQIDKLNSELSSIKNIMGCKNMSDEIKENPEAVTPDTQKDGEKSEKVSEPSVETPTEAEVPKVDSPPAEPVANVEGKSLIDMKSRIDKIEASLKSVIEENANLKSILEKAQYKSKGAEVKESKTQEVKSLGPLDSI